MSTVVLASHLPGEGHFRSERHRVLAVPCVADTDYSQGWQALWDTDLTIVGVEHDHEVSDELVQGLLDCPHSLCAWAYLLHMPSTGGASHYAQRDGGPNYGDWIKPGVRWCGFSGIGFCKIAPEARVRSLAESPWQIVDCAISRATDGDWHVHWPAIDHFHR